MSCFIAQNSQQSFSVYFLLLFDQELVYLFFIVMCITRIGLRRIIILLLLYSNSLLNFSNGIFQIRQYVKLIKNYQHVICVNLFIFSAFYYFNDFFLLFHPSVNSSIQHFTCMNQPY